jgi:hypothetical protein
MEQEKKEWEPVFVCKMKRNAFGKMGPVLCWPNGNIVEDQVDCEVSNPLDGLARVKLTFNATGRLIEIKGEEDG